MAEERGKSSGSFLLLDEYFAAGNDAFLNELFGITDPRKLAGFVDRWKSDPRPWAREKIFDYLDRPLSTPGHNVVVKRLFKQAEANRDSQMMAAMVHAIDCLVRRQRKTKHRYNWQSRESWTEEFLATPRDNIIAAKPRLASNPKTLERVQVPGRRPPKGGRLFSYRTRYYLRRRAWRYFRWMGFQRPADYVAGAASILARYTDEDLTKGEHILDSWCLLNIVTAGTRRYDLTAAHVRINEGRTLNELTPAPKFPKLWQAAGAAEILWNLLGIARSRLVRGWTLQMLRDQHTEFLRSLRPEQLLPLFESSDDDIQQFAAQLLESLPGMPTLPIASWLKLLETRNPAALTTICSLMIKYVTSERLDLRQTIALARAAMTPVASLGLAFLKTRAIITADDRSAVSDLALAQCSAAAPAITSYALEIVGSQANYDVSLVSRFFDALLKPTRTAAWAWLTPESAGYNDAALWSRLVETPYEDVRLSLVKILEARAKLPGAGIDQLTPVWTAVLLGIHRGGRHKIKSLHQISRALVERPESAEKLLPVIAVAIRSVRPAEARVGLAAVVHAVEADATLRGPAAAAIPELTFVSEGATA